MRAGPTAVDIVQSPSNVEDVECGMQGMLMASKSNKKEGKGGEAGGEEKKPKKLQSTRCQSVVQTNHAYAVHV